MQLTGFTKLIPAFTMLINFTPLGPNYRIGPNNPGVIFEYSPSLSNGSYLISEPGYGTNVNASFVFGSDTVTLDADKGHARLDFKGVAHTDDNVDIFVAFTGSVKNSPQTSKLFSGDPTFNGSEYGSGFIQAYMAVGPEKYKHLEDTVFVGSQRYLWNGEILGLEFKLSEVVQG